MSKHEPRSPSIKAEADSMDFKVSWAGRKSGLFFTIKNNGDKTLDDMRRFARVFYPSCIMTSGGWGEATFKVKDAEKPKVEPAPVNNGLVLGFNWRTSAEGQASVRANAVFIYGKLVAGGMDVKTAKNAVERLFNDGWKEGYEDGYEAGRDSVGPDEFDK